MNFLRWVLGLMASGVVLIGGMLGMARRADPVPHVIVTTYEGMGMVAYMIEVDDGTVRRLNGPDLLNTRLMSVSPDGKWLIYEAGGRAYRTTLWGTRARQIEFPKVDIQVASYGYHQWSGDGEWLVMETIDLDMTELMPEQHLYRINMDTLRTEQLSQHLPYRPHYGDVFFYPTPDQSGIVYYGTNDEHEEPSIELYGVEIATGRENRLTTMADIEYPEGWFGEWLIYWSSTNPTLFRVRRDGTGEQSLLTVGNFEWMVHEPIDGWVYIGSYRDELLDGELYRVRWDGTELQRLTTMDGYENFIAITPNAAWIYFANGETVYRMQTDGTGLQRVMEGVAVGQRIGWSDDGSAFYFLDGQHSVTGLLRRLIPATATIETLGAVHTVPILLSSDHHWLAYVGSTDAQRGITVMETAMGTEKLLRLPLTSFELFDWMPLAEQEWQPDRTVLGGLIGLVGSVGLGRLRKWR